MKSTARQMAGRTDVIAHADHRGISVCRPEWCQVSSLSIVLSVGVSLPALLAPRLSAQPVITIPPTPSCATCEIRLDTIAVIGDPDGPGILYEQSRVQMAPDGRLFVTSNAAEPGVIKVFDPQGTYVTAFGRVGEAPGEYQWPYVVPDNHIMHIVDWQLNRITTLNYDFEVVGTHRLPFQPLGAISFRTNQLIFNARAATREYFGLPLHLYDHASGAALRSFGAVSERIIPGRGGDRGLRRIALADADAVWSAPRDQYRVELWNTGGGHLTATYERAPEGFDSWERTPGLARTRPPPPDLWALWQDDGDRLWVVVHVAAADWRPQPPAAMIQGMEYTSDMQMNQLYDTVVEVVIPDGDHARLHARARFSQRLLGFAGEGIVYFYDEDEFGNPMYVVLRLRIAS